MLTSQLRERDEDELVASLVLSRSSLSSCRSFSSRAEFGRTECDRGKLQNRTKMSITFLLRGIENRPFVIARSRWPTATLYARSTQAIVHVVDAQNNRSFSNRRLITPKRPMTTSSSRRNASSSRAESELLVSGQCSSTRTLLIIGIDRVKHRYTMKSMRGFAAELPDDLKSELEKSPAVKYVGVYAQAAAVWIVAHFGNAEPDSSVSIAN